MDRLREFLRDNKVVLIVGALLLGGWLYLRTPATPIGSMAELDRKLSGQQPVVLEFFGNT
jgi:hypothetical protein